MNILCDTSVNIPKYFQIYTYNVHIMRLLGDVFIFLLSLEEEFDLKKDVDDAGTHKSTKSFSLLSSFLSTFPHTTYFHTSI